MSAPDDTSGDARMRIVYLDHVAQLSGGEIALLRLLPHLDGVRPHVVLAEHGPLLDRLQRAGISTEVLQLSDESQRFRKGRVHAGELSVSVTRDTGVYVLRLARRLRRLKPDLVHANSLKSGVYGSLAARLAGIPLVWHVRDRISEDYLPAHAVRLIRSMTRRFPAAVIANSQTTADTLAREARPVVIPPAISLDDVPPPPPDRATRDTAVYGMIGRLAPWKGHELFLRAFARAFPSGTESAVVVGEAMFGEQEYAMQLETLARSLGLADRVEFRGFREDVWAELARIDVLVHASITPEPFGQVVLEGMAAGVPVVAAGAGGPAEILDHDRTGLLFEPRNSEQLEGALIRLRDPALRERLAGAAREEVSLYAPPDIARRVEELYRSVLAARGTWVKGVKEGNPHGTGGNAVKGNPGGSRMNSVKENPPPGARLNTMNEDPPTGAPTAPVEPEPPRRQSGPRDSGLVEDRSTSLRPPSAWEPAIPPVSMSSQEREVTARDYLRPLVRRRWLVLIIVVLATAATYGYYARQPKVFEASTKILIAASGNPLDQTAAELSDRTVQDQAGLLASLDVARPVARRLGRPDEATALAASIRTQVAPGSDFVEITARRPQARDAARVANAFARAFVQNRTDAVRKQVTKAINEANSQLDQLPRTPSNAAERASIADSIRQLRLTAAVSSGSASQVDPALPPTSPAAPHPVRDTVLALVLSFIGAAGLAFALEALDRRPRRLEELTPLYGMPILAAMPHAHVGVYEEEGLAAVNPEFKEPLRQLRTNIRLAALDRPFKCILVTSAIAGEGKSTVVRNLTLVLREGGLRVAVVDGDLRRPALARFFNQRPEPGLTDVLTERESLDDALVRVPVQVHGLDTLARMGASSAAETTNGAAGPDAKPDAGTISLLTAGPVPADPQAVLTADRTRMLLEGLAADYDIVLIDSPPLLHVSDAVAFASWVDAVVIVARLGQVTRDNARRVPQVLGMVTGANPIGIVANDVPAAEGHSYGYGYGY